MNYEIRTLSYDELKTSRGFEQTVKEYVFEFSGGLEGAPQIDWDAYEQIKDALTIVGVFLANELVGLAAMSFSMSKHYDKRIGVAEAFYLRPKHRKGRVGLVLIRGIKQACRAEGADGLIFSCPPNSKLEDLAKLLGWVDIRHNYWVPL